MKENILIIGDLHLPYTHEEYLEHCINTQQKYKTNKTIFIGDIVDNHASSYYETNPDGHSAGSELNEVKKQINLWKRWFKKADVCLGNHDRLIMRKAFSNGISQQWIRGYSEVLQTPHWEFQLSFTYNNVIYLHGEGCGNLTQSIYRHRSSIVAGHFHTQFKIDFSSSEKDLLFGMNVGCGINPTMYAFEYAKYNNARPILGCGVVLDNGKQPILCPMKM